MNNENKIKVKKRRKHRIGDAIVFNYCILLILVTLVVGAAWVRSLFLLKFIIIAMIDISIFILILRKLREE